MTDEAPAPKPFQRPTPRLAGLLWGNAKVGKTTYAASSPGNKYIINLDPEGWLSVGNKPDLADVWDYSDQAPDAIIEVMTKTIGTKIIQSNMQPGDTCMFDSCTLFNQAALLTAIKRGVGASTKFTPSIEAPGLAAYGARTQFVIAAMSQVIRATRAKGAHVWFMAHEDTPERNEKGDFLYQTILLSENAINQSGAAVSEIWWMREANNARHIAIRPTQLHKPMGSRIFRMDEGADFKLKYDPEKPDLDQPMSIASLWKRYTDGNLTKLSLPEDKNGR
jgi:hypothetical protein